MNKLGAKYKAIKNVDERRKAFLLDVAGFYNSSNRALAEDGACVYSATNVSPGCAIGRCLSPSLRRRLDKGVTKGIFSIYHKPYLQNRLPKWMVEMGPSFLNAVQRFHDHETNWTNNGLSEMGKRNFEFLKFSNFNSN